MWVKTSCLVISTLGIAVALLTGCGSSSDSASAAPPTKAVFIRRGDAICLHAQQREQAVIKRLLAENGDKPALGRAARVEIILHSLLPPWEQMSTQLSAMDLPKEDQRQAKEVVDAYEKSIDAARSKPAAVASTGAFLGFAHANELAGQFGFKTCSTI